MPSVIPTKYREGKIVKLFAHHVSEVLARRVFGVKFKTEMIFGRVIKSSYVLNEGSERRKLEIFVT
jgi:hypothetical protein